jgi:hypothetical protein
MTNDFIMITNNTMINELATVEEAKILKSALTKLATKNGCSRFRVFVMADTVYCDKVIPGSALIYGVNTKSKVEYRVDIGFKKVSKFAIETPDIDDISWMPNDMIENRYKFVFKPAADFKVMARRIGRIQFWNRVK